MQRRHVLLSAVALLGSGAALALKSGDESVAVYVVPLDDVPEALSATVARALARQLGIRVRAAMRLPPLRLPRLPGTEQYAAEALLEQAVRASARLPGLGPKTYRLFITARDINAQSGGFRYQFSMHSPNLHCSVVSMARLFEYENGEPRLTDRTGERTVKLAKRAVGELHLGWKRSTDPQDLMYAPLMGLEDLDRIGNEHREEAPQAPPPAAPSSPPRKGGTLIAT
ncbi:hypothetical protein LK540_14540 [Massilia sp. IC2-278]|uniref:hypothetical protein n=1 Tax=Massilia sp. IC2-278 TaxID=2887200 RepID=UPI001E574594|nr:hypothetical protein [Massilia sp. IC2-278]MCC2961645.1 hypothetical protein [Massilia sp. IC2-278]